MEEMSRREKIAIARRAVGDPRALYAGRREESEQTIGSGQPEQEENMPSTFVLRLFFSFFLFLTVLCVTRFDALGEERTADCHTQVQRALRKQELFDSVKKFFIAQSPM